MKKIRTITFIVFGVVSTSGIALSSFNVAHDHSVHSEKTLGHSGGTDAYGCHTNHKTGVYHCHNPK